MQNINQIFGEYQGYKFIDGDKPLENLDTFVNINKQEWNTEDLALVHATNYFPKNVIFSNLDGKKIISGETEINGKIKKFSYINPRTTVHFTLNGVAGTHEFGDWENKNYVIIEPLIKHIDDVVNLFPGDTYFSKSVNLSNEAVFLIKKNALDNIDKSELQGKNVIIFTGDLQIVILETLMSMGYLPQRIGKYSWTIGNEIFFKYLNKMKNKNPNLTTGQHMHSEYDKNDKSLSDICEAISIMRDGLTIDPSQEIIVDIEELINLYDLYLENNKKLFKYKTDNELDDNIINFKDFINNYHVDLQDNDIFFIKNANDWNNKNSKNNIISNNLQEQIYKKIKLYEKNKINEQKRHQKLKDLNDLFELLDNLSKLQLKELPGFYSGTPEHNIIHNMLRFKVGREDYFYVDSKNNYIKFIIGTEIFWNFVQQIPNIQLYNDCIGKLDLDENITVLEAQQTLRYYGVLYQKYLEQLNLSEPEQNGPSRGFIKFIYVLIVISLTIIFIMFYFLFK